MPKNGAPKHDQVDAAIAATEQAVVMEQVTVTIATTGRPVVIGFPQDMTDSELLEFVGWCGQNLRVHLFQRRNAVAGGRIMGPNGHPVLKS